MNEILSIKLAPYLLKPRQIENLAEEYYGKPLQIAGADERSETTLDFEFNDVSLTEDEKVLDTEGKELSIQFLAALESFRKPKPRKRNT